MKDSIDLNFLREKVGTLWSTVTSVQSGRRTGRSAAARPSKACGDVTSCTRCRSMYSSAVPSEVPSTTWSSQILSYIVRGPDDWMLIECRVVLAAALASPRRVSCRRSMARDDPQPDASAGGSSRARNEWARPRSRGLAA